jgi:predicted DNA-binding protein (UPF0251 family)
MSAPYSKPLSDLATDELDQRVVDLKRAGLSFQQIADELEISKSAAHRAFQRARKRLHEATSEDVAEWVAEQVGRIQLEREAVMDVLEARHVHVSNGVLVRDQDGKPILDDAPVLQAVDRLVKLDDQETKLLGRYPKAEVDLSGSLRIELVGIDTADLA